MTPETNLQNPSLDPDLLNAAYSPVVRKTVRGGDKLTGVKPELIDHWNSLRDEFSKAGITPEIKSGFRTAEQQNALYRNPATRARTKGNDGYAQISPHQRGDALDISFPAYQRAKGRQIIADYAKRTGLHVPSDEPWHISLGKAQQTLDPDLMSAGYEQPQEPKPTPQLDPDLLNAAYGESQQFAPKVPKVTSEVRDYEPEKLEPLKFQPADLSNETNLVTRAATGVAENARMQGMELPKTHPNLLGQRVAAKFDHQPTQEEVDDALIEQLGKGYGTIAKKFRDETGVPLTQNNVAVDKQPDGSYIAHARPTQGFIDAVNAYALGGRSAYENTLTSQQMGKAAMARDVQQELKRSEGVTQDLGQAGAREVGRNAQFLQNLGDVVQGRAPEDDPNARAIAAAEQSIPSQKTNIGSLAEIPLGAAGAITRAESLGGAAGFPASAAIENAQAGPEAAYRAGIMTAPILAAGPIAESVGAGNVGTRAIAGAGMAAPAIASGASPKEIGKSFLTGAAFPVGQRGEGERPTELGIERAPVGGVQGRGALDAEAQLAEREAKVRPTFLRDDEGNPVARVLNPEEVAQGEKPKIRPVHQADTQARDEAGKFAVEPLSDQSAAPFATEQQARNYVDRLPQTERQKWNAAADEAKPFGKEWLPFANKYFAATEAPPSTPAQEAQQPPMEPAVPPAEKLPEAATTPAPEQGATTATPPNLPELRKYAQGVVDDNQGIKEVRLIGSTAAKGHGRDTDILYDLGDVKLPKDEGDAVEKIIEILEKHDHLDAGLAHDIFIKAGDRYFYRASGAGPFIVENSEYGKAQEGKPSIVLAEKAAQPATAETTAIPPTVSETQPPPSTTSARKAQLAADRAELELPDLPQPERRSWKNALLEAQSEGLDKRANAIADGVIRQPRPLTDKETAGLTLRLQQIKNEHADALAAVDTAQGDALVEARSRANDLEAEFDKLSDAVKQSGTEKGRALASQKLTINQDFGLVSMLNRYKVKTGKEPSSEIRAQIETQSKRIADLETQLAKAHEDAAAKAASESVAKIQREVRRSQRQASKQSLNDEAAVIKSNIAAEFARLKSQATKQTTLSQQGLGLLDPDGVITRELAKYVRNRVQAGVTDAAQIVDDAHALIKEFAEGVTKRQVQEAISGYNRLAQNTRSELQKQVDTLKSNMRRELAEVDVAAGRRTERPQGPRLSDKNSPLLGPLQGPKLSDAPKFGPKETKAQIQRRYQKQINELERRIKEQDFAPKSKRGPTVLDADTQKIQVNLERAKQDFQRKLRAWEYSQRSHTEKLADLTVNWARAAKLMYVSTLGKLGSAATGRMVMSPLENLVGEIPHRLMPELSKQATTEGGGFSKAAEVAALWKSGRFRQVLDQLTKGSSDIDVLFGSKKSIDKEMSSPGLLGLPGRVHGAMKEFPRQAEFDRAFIKVLKNYERAGRDITRPDTQLAARMEAFNSAERARFQQRNVVSDTFNNAMASLERQGGLGKGLSKVGRFIFPITRVPVNVVGETLNYTFGLPRAAIEHMTRAIRGTMTPEKANNIMRAYKKGGVGLAVMAYAYLHPEQFGGYYQRGEKRDEKEPQAGEVMFFGKRIPKVLTHVPILEAAQFAATARRVMDKMAEQGKGDTTLEGGLAAGKGLAEQVPFYETPARFFAGQEGSRGIAQAGGELVRGTIPGFIQEAAKLTDKDKEGQPLPRSPQGSFAQRFGQTVEMGVPGLRQRVPLNESKLSAQRKQSFLSRFMQGKIGEADLNRARKASELTQSEVDSILNEKDLSKEYNPRQLQFYKGPTLTSNKTSPTLDRYERMDVRQRAEVRNIMQDKADAILDSDALTEEQKKSFADRIRRVGLLVRGAPK